MSANETPSPLGWSISAGKGLAPAGLVRLSEDEQQFVLTLSSRFREWSKHHDLSAIAQATPSVQDELADAARGRKAGPHSQSKDGPQIAALEVERLLVAQAEAEGLELDADQRQYLLAAALAHLVGFAPLDYFLSDPSLEEVAVIGMNLPVYVYRRKKGWEATAACITSLEHLIHLINKMSRPLGRRVSAESPRINALLPDGSRLHASIPPLSGGEITIRRHAVRAWSAADLLASGSINAEALALLWLAFQSDSSVLVAGNTASGKTTLLDALLGFVPLGERMLIIEETPELRPSHPHCVHLVCNPELNISMAELVRDSLRMRPDRVVVGEVRTPAETQAYMETLLSGQARGSYATFHAQSSGECLRRLVNLGASPDDLASLDFLVLQRRIAHYNPKTHQSQELRRCLGIWMMQEGTADAKLPVPLALMTYDAKSDSMKSAPALAKGLERLAQKMGVSATQCRTLLSSRAQFLHTLPSNAEPGGVLEKLQKFAYR